MSRDLLNSKEAARRLNITTDQLTALVQDGEISYINVGRGMKRPRRRYAEEDLADFLERRRGRECRSIETKDRRSISSTFNTTVVGFMDRRNARLAKTPKNSRPQS
jgi:excisionase family DNA binding protein